MRAEGCELLLDGLLKLVRFGAGLLAKGQEVLQGDTGIDTALSEAENFAKSLVVKDDLFVGVE